MAVNNIDTAWTLLAHGVVGTLEYRDDLENLGAACPLLAKACRSACNTKSLWTKLDKVDARAYPIVCAPPEPMYIAPSRFKSPFIGELVTSVIHYTITAFECVNDTILPTEEGKYTYFDVYGYHRSRDGMHVGSKYTNNAKYDTLYTASRSVFACQEYPYGALLDLSHIRLAGNHDTYLASLYLGDLLWFLQGEERDISRPSAYSLRGRVKDDEVVFSDTDFTIRNDAAAHGMIFFALDGMPDNAYIKVRLNASHTAHDDVTYTVKLGKLTSHCYGVNGSRLSYEDSIRGDVSFGCPSEMLTDDMLKHKYTLEEINEFLARDGVEFILPEQIFFII